MISFENTGKAYRNRKGVINWVFRNIDAALPAGKSIGILAPESQGKSTFISLAAGNEQPSEGRIYRHGRISWPYNSKTNISPKLTGKQNLRFLTDVYGRNFAEAYDFVSEFSDLGKYLDAPLKQYNSEMKSRLSISALFAMDFNYILVDESMDGGDASFRRKCSTYLEDNKEKLTFLIASSNPQIISRYCQAAGLLNGGNLTLYDNVDDAIEEFNKVNQELV